MAQQSEVGLFVDFDNIRYGMLNLFGEEPDPQALIEKARKYGPVAVAYAYADFSAHPAIYRRKLEVAGIAPRDVPRVNPDALNKSSSDMAMLMDIIDCLLDRPYVKTLVLMTGDSDFIRVTARARHRFGKRVVISGVPGSVSGDLIESADSYDPLGTDAASQGSSARTPVDDQTNLLRLLLWLNDHRPYMTWGFIRSHALSPHHALGISEERLTSLLTEIKEHGILAESQRLAEDGRTLRTLELNLEHEAVMAARELGPPPFRDRPSHGRRSPSALDEKAPLAAPTAAVEPLQAVPAMSASASPAVVPQADAERTADRPAEAKRPSQPDAEPQAEPERPSAAELMTEGQPASQCPTEASASRDSAA